MTGTVFLLILLCDNTDPDENNGTADLHSDDVISHR